MKTIHREQARAKMHMRNHTQQYAEPILAGFGITYDIVTGKMRNWYQDKGDVKRWADNDMPVEVEHEQAA